MDNRHVRLSYVDTNINVTECMRACVCVCVFVRHMYNIYKLKLAVLLCSSHSVEFTNVATRYSSINTQ
jgi:hypothetical protein